MFCLRKAREKIGSMPLDAPAIIEIVPVGATVNRQAFLYGLSPRCAASESYHAGNAPRSSAKASDSASALSRMNAISLRPSSTASSVS